MTRHVVQQGECLNSIGLAYGLLPETIWNYPENAGVKAKRKDMNILFPGDVLTIPDLRIQDHPAPSGQRHKFVRRQVPAKFRVRLLKDGKPRAGESYTLDVDGLTFSGRTDGSGALEHAIPPAAKSGLLLLAGGAERYPLTLGSLNPISEPSGVQQRLRHLGYAAGEPTEAPAPELRAAISKFRRDHSLPASEEIDDTLTAKLKEVYGS